MNHLLQHFKTLTKHPQNAEELKGLILQLAIQGKLTENWREENPNVESASDLLNKIESEKKQLVKEKKIKNSKRLPIVDDEEKFFDIPDTWIWERLGNIGNIFNGNSVNKSIKQAKYEGLEEGYPYIATKDVGYLYDDINHDNGVRIPFNEPKFKVARRNTILICSEGGSAGKKMGILEEDCCFGNKLYAVEQYGKIESLYILSLYGSLSFSKAFKNKMTGIIGGISRNNFANLIIPIPPLEEQKAIVEIVNKLFQEIEQLEDQTKTRIQLKEDFVSSSLQRLTQADNVNKEWQFLQSYFTEFFTEKKNIKLLRDTILQLAVQGKLTSKWRAQYPNTESASELLKRIKAEKQELIAQKKIKGKHKLHQKAKKEPTFSVPYSWEITRFWDVIWCFRGHNPPKSEFIHEPREGYVRFVQITDFKTDSRAVYVPESHKLKRVKKGEILMAAYRHIGKLSRKMEGAFNVALCKVNCIDPFDIDYLEMLIGTSIVKGELLAESERGHIPSMHSDHLLSLWVPIPPLEEQKAIVEQVNILMTLCDSLEKQIENSKAQLEQLMQSCMREVFEEN